MNNEYSHLEQYSDEWKRWHLRQGQPLDFSSHLSEKSRTIQADWLAEAVNNGVAVDVHNAVIEGPLNFKFVFFQKEFVLKRSKILHPANFSFATFQQTLNFSSSVFSDTVDFSSACINSEVVFVETIFEQRAEFRDAGITGIFDCRKSTFHGVSFQRVTFDKSTLFREARFEGGEKADFTSARIGGQAAFTRAIFTCPVVFYETRIIQDAFFNPASFADVANFTAIQVDGTAYFDFGTVFGGWTSFNMAKVKLSCFFDQARFENADFGNMVIEGQTSFIGAQFAGITNFDEAEIMGRALFHGAEFQGPVFFVGAKFHAGVYFQHAVLKGIYYHGTIFHQLVSFEATSCGPRVQFDSEIKIYGEIVDSTLGTKEDLPIADRMRRSVDLRGCIYERIDIASWEWLMELLEPFDRQPYMQLEKTLRIAGEDKLADAVYFKRRRLEGSRKSGLHRIGDEILRVLVGYGVKPLRLFGWIFACIFLGAIVFQMEGAVCPGVTSGKTESATVTMVNCQEAGACQLSFSEALWFSLSIFSPVELPRGKVWEPSRQPIVVRINSTDLRVMSYASFASILKLAGWVIVPMGIAGLAGLFKRSGAP